MKKNRWRFILLTSWILFSVAFLLREVLLRISSVDDKSLLPWALTHSPSHWAIMLTLGTLAYAMFIFAPLQLPFMAVWTVRKVPIPAGKKLPVLLIPCALISTWWVTDTLRNPPDSKAHFEAVLAHPLPVGSTHFMAIHPLGTGTFSEVWGSVHGYRMKLDSKDATDYCRSLGGAQYDFVVESLAEPYDAFLSSLPKDWGYALGMPHLQVHQLPPICGKPAFAMVDPTRNDMLVMAWQQGQLDTKPSQRLYPVRSAEPDFYAQTKSKSGQRDVSPTSRSKD
ncbi:hypothetical protein [Verrucomicrobium sp. BvORR106]|uniref:hypothetical protein n=1 Tax=Verrucomicrobium sp. BvORR106 TaxID=1403819 RepID=UPI00056F7646|nr:hypothetical protein [Verrucomicrobium sp. BvORR106]